MAVKIAPLNSFEKSENKSLIDLYRVLIASRYQAVDVADIERNIGRPPYVASRKFDGELWYVICNGADSMLVAANGRTLSGDHPILLEAAKLPANMILAGELYAPNGTRERVGDVGKALASKGDGLQFAAFDVVSDVDGTFEFVAFADRRTKLSALNKDSALHSVEFHGFSTASEIEGLVQSLLQSGAEGVVVHSADGRIAKVKAGQSIDAVIVGFTERDGVSGTEIRSVLLGLKDDDSFTIIGTAGNFVQEMDRSLLFKQLKPLIVESDFRHTASTGQAYRMVSPSLVIEVKALDVQSFDSRGLQIRQSSIVHTEGRWKAGPQIAAVQLINATGIRLREDKSVDSDGASWRQVAEFAPAHVKREDLPKSEVIRRQVWTKTSADKTDVRKLVVWKTNKDLIDQSFPAYVVHWTDFSKGRKSPLDREVKPAPTEEAALRLAEQMIEDNIKKGWNEIV